MKFYADPYSRKLQRRLAYLYAQREYALQALAPVYAPRHRVISDAGYAWMTYLREGIGSASTYERDESWRRREEHD